MTPELIASGAPSPHLAGLIRPKDLLRFQQFIKEKGDCWLWDGFKDRKGYGKFWFQGKSWWAHRWAYAVFNGDIPAGKTIDHECHNPSCVRPSHLGILSRSENTALGNVNRAVVAEELEEI